MSSLRLVLFDQLTHDVSALQGIDINEDIVLICEVRNETNYVKHHKKKIAFLFSAMRHFAQELQDKGVQVRYVKLDDEGNAGSFTGEIKRALEAHKISRIISTFPGEYRVLEEMKTWQVKFGIDVEIRNDDRFLATPEEFANWANGRKQLRMEYFYRDMRQATLF